MSEERYSFPVHQGLTSLALWTLGLSHCLWAIRALGRLSNIPGPTLSLPRALQCLQWGMHWVTPDLSLREL